MISAIVCKGRSISYRDNTNNLRNSPDLKKPINLKELQEKAIFKKNRVKNLIRIEERARQKLKEIREKSRIRILTRKHMAEENQKKVMRIAKSLEREKTIRETIKKQREQTKSNIELGRETVMKMKEKIAQEVKDHLSSKRTDRFVHRSLPNYQFFKHDTFKVKRQNYF